MPDSPFNPRFFCDSCQMVVSAIIQRHEFKPGLRIKTLTCPRCRHDQTVELPMPETSNAPSRLA